MGEYFFFSQFPLKDDTAMPQIISSTQYTLNLTPLVISKKSEYKLYLMRVRSLK